MLSVETGFRVQPSLRTPLPVSECQSSSLPCTDGRSRLPSSEGGVLTSALPPVLPPPCGGWDNLAVSGRAPATLPVGFGGCPRACLPPSHRSVEGPSRPSRGGRDSFRGRGRPSTATRTVDPVAEMDQLLLEPVSLSYVANQYELDLCATAKMNATANFRAASKMNGSEGHHAARRELAILEGIHSNFDSAHVGHSEVW